MVHLSSKDFFKSIKKESRDYSEELSEGFPYFCMKIFWDNLSNDDIENALDGLKTNDESIDGFFVDEENKEINIFQCKSCESEKQIRALKKESLSYLVVIESKLKNHEFIDNHKNPKIKEIAKEFSIYNKQGFKTKLYFFHLGHADKNIINYHDEIIYYGLKDLLDEYQEYLSKIDRTEPPHIEINLNYDHLTPNISNTHKSMVSVITGDEIINLREKYRYKLFDKNLRFGLGRNKVNKGIVETALNEPNSFYFYNNGITITCKGFKYKETNGKLRVEYPQIINGAQTVNAIYDAFKQKENKLSRENGNESGLKAKEQFKQLKILFRIIQDEEKDGKKTSLFEEKVIRFNNSQNSIKETDFYANHREQINLQDLFSRFGYFYEIKRGDRKYLDLGKEEHNLLKKRKKDFKYWDEKLDIEKLASFWMAYTIDPSSDKIKKSNIFGYAQDRHYDTLFRTEEFTENKVKEMILALNLFSVITGQVEIYGSTIKKGQIISKMSKVKKDDADSNKKFSNIKELIQGSLFLGQMVKKDVDDQKTFFENKDELLKQLKAYQFFSNGKYLTLAIFGLIMQKCEYTKSLVNTDLFMDKEFIKHKIVSIWLKTILDELIKKEYETFIKESGTSLMTFYARASTFEQIKNRFKNLKYDKDQELTKIFPLNI